MSNAERIGWVATTGLAVAGLAWSGTAWPGEAANSNPITVQVAQSAVCPGLDPARGSAAVLAWHDGGQMELQELSGVSSRRVVEPGAVLRLAQPAGAVQVGLGPGTKGGAASYTVDAGGMERGLSATSCDAPGTEAWFVGAESTASITTEVVLTNTDTTQASVDLSFYGAGGRITALGSRSVQVPGGRSVKVGLGPLVHTDDRFAIQVMASQGRVHASARLRSFAEGETKGSGVEWLPQATVPRTDVAIPAIPSGSGKRSLVLANPGARASDVQITQLTASGAKAVPGMEKLTIPPESTVSIPFDSALKGEAVGLRLTGSQPFTAGVRAYGADTAGDLGAVGATRPFSGEVVVPLQTHALTGRLQLSNPGDEPARATVEFLTADGKHMSEKVLELGPASTQVLETPKGDYIVTRIDVTQGAVVGGVVLTGDAGGLAGLAILPLRGDSSSDLVVDPQRDPGYASRS